MQLVRSFDASDDCDLWRDGIFSKMSRYLCLSRKVHMNVYWFCLCRHNVSQKQQMQCVYVIYN